MSGRFGYGKPKDEPRASPDRVSLVARTASGGGDLPAGKPYVVGVCPTSGDTVVVFEFDENSVLELRRLCRYTGAKIGTAKLLPGSFATFGGQSTDESAPACWTGGGWELKQTQAGAVLNRMPAGVL